MSAPTAPMFAPSVPEDEAIVQTTSADVDQDTVMADAEADNALTSTTVLQPETEAMQAAPRPVSPGTGQVANDDMQTSPTKLAPAASASKPQSKHTSTMDTNVKQSNNGEDSEAETDIASTTNTPVKIRTRPGLHYSLDSTGITPKQTAPKRKSETSEIEDSRRSQSPDLPTSSAANSTAKKLRLSPVPMPDFAQTSSELSDHESGTPDVESPSSDYQSQTKHSRLDRVSDDSRAKTEPRMRSHSPNQSRTLHRRSSSYHTGAAAAAASSTDRERRTRNRASLDRPGSNENTPVPARMRHQNSTPAHSPMARYKDSTGRTQLAQACDKGQIDRVKTLLTDDHPDGYINEPDNAETSPIQMAALKGHVEIVKLLINAGAKLDVKNREGDTPLIDAVENSHSDVVELLLAQPDLNPWHLNHRGYRAFNLVNDDEEKEKIEQMLKTACEDWTARHPDEVHETVRLQAPKTRDIHYVAPNLANMRDFCQDGDLDGVKNMRSGMVPIDNSCLVAAARGGHVDTLNEILDYARTRSIPYDPDPATVDGETPMLAAIERGNRDVIQRLLQWDHEGLDARRKINGKTYYETVESMPMKPPGWDGISRMLKDAYDDFTRASSTRGSQSPGMSSCARVSKSLKLRKQILVKSSLSSSLSIIESSTSITNHDRL